ncbi:hypothetical protein MELA_00367 [Candidatus Methylomirabilis lanthanidiphila]|uniref:Glycosyltransferase n=1 Tax=Candidatus Methylomirabilis lanthanidiphila TaxID=2211376 RepID=A0A564ZFS0_9BACT|nr:glycosyltransferase family 4 protein [Candidatus Methylomirabilis lanthanidiphila]VUZ84003.1 hypothetical protein MELA_00367 [Candidatus Methylomirabilis lanthanidiphila]
MKPRLLFISPFIPAHSGNGPAKRAASTLQVLGDRFDIHLLVASSGPRLNGAVETMPGHPREVATVPVRLWPDPRAGLKRMMAAFPWLYRRCFAAPFEWQVMSRAAFDYPFRETVFDVVHVFRLYSIPVLDFIRARATVGAVWLDLDDVESSTRRELAALRRSRGEYLAAAQCAAEAEQYARIEADRVPSFDRVFVCSSEDCEHLRTLRIHAAPERAPNVVSAPASPPAAKPRHSPFRFLFVGTLGYLPNMDGLEWFASDILPRLKEAAPAPFVIHVVGGGLPRHVAAVLASRPEMKIDGWVPDMEPVYRDADAVIIPLRAGGGTRIKLLEAFAHGCPVISTVAGARGIDADPGRHLLIADQPAEFAAGCARLMTDAELSACLSASAGSLVRERYGAAALTEVLG